jgi:hypothetical protein
VEDPPVEVDVGDEGGGARRRRGDETIDTFL